jgi:acyl-CoA synthetase (AMP-forming)/AMP-acid ligase II
MFARRLLSRPPVLKAVPLHSRATSTYIVKSKFINEDLESKNYENSVPKTVLKKFLDEGVRDKVALMDGFTKETATYGQLYQRTYSCAKSLKDKYGVQKGACVGIMSPNHINFFTAFHGVGLTGGCSTTINPTYVEAEIEYQMKTTNAMMLIAHPLCLEKALAIGKKLEIPVLTLGEATDDTKSFNDLLQIPLEKSQPDALGADVDVDSLMTIPFSSGTTGLAKGVMLTHRNLISNFYQSMTLEGQYMANASIIIPLPFFHVFGMVMGICMPLMVAAKVVLMPAFDMVKFLELVQSEKISRAYLVPPIILGLAKAPIVDKYDLSSLKTVLSGAAPLGADVQNECAKRLNLLVKQGWGMTELSPVATITDETHASNNTGSCGYLLPCTEAKIIDLETRQLLPSTDSGELAIRGPQVMRGYLNNKEATDGVMMDDGFMLTGDVAHFDKNGLLYVIDRCKELIKFKGFQVAPAELEDLILSMPQVKDVVVIPVLDDAAGELPRAYVVKQDGAELTEDEVSAFVEAKVSPHKKLRGGVVFADEIPRSASGKIMRRLQVEMDRAPK